MSKGWDNRIPYRLGTDHYCTYEEDGSYVRMGDMVTLCWDDWIGGTYQERESSGELLEVSYDEDGFISQVTLLVEEWEGREGEGRCLVCPCDGTFHRMEAQDGTD